MIRVLLLLCSLALALVGNDAPTMDPIPALTYAEGTRDEASCTIHVTGIGPGSPAESGQTVTVEAGVADNGLATVKRITFNVVAGTADIVLQPSFSTNGSTLVYVSARDDAGGITVGTCTVTVVSVPNPPNWTNMQFFHVLTGQTVALTFTNIGVYDADLPPNDSLVITLVKPTPLGDLRNGSTVLNAGDTFTFADVLAGRLSFRHNGTSTTSYDQIGLTVSDGVFPPVPAGLPVIFDGYARPVLTLPATTALWTEGAGPVALCPSATLSDADTTVFRGQVLTTLVTPVNDAHNQLSLHHDGAGPGQIGIAGPTVSYAGQPIATWSGGQAGIPLTVTFTTMDATRDAVEAVLRNIRFDRSGQSAPGSPLAFQVALSDGAAGVSDPATSSIALQLVDDPPQITTTWVGVFAGLKRSVALTVADPDSTAFTWAVLTQPATVHIDLIDAATGRITITPGPAVVAGDHFTVSVSDRVNPPVVATIVLAITSLDDVRPQALTDAPFEAVAGEILTVDVSWDTAVGVTIDGDVPTGVQLTPLAENRVRLTWTVPVAEAPGLRSFALFADDDLNHHTGRLPVLLLVRPRPGGVN